MNKPKQDYSKILNLRATDSIGKELSDRQLEVIGKGYEFLNKKENNVFYIADEVGLGKTYIAAGIMMLFRHFSENKSSHQDLVIVPKKNLQTKWQKDLNNFSKNNYLKKNDEILEQYETGISIKERIYPIDEKDPITIMRMTSFSGIGMRRKGRDSEILRDYLMDIIFPKNDFAKNILQKAFNLKWFNKIDGNERKLRNLVAYLLNISSPRLNCVVIDEAHNYKYGPDSEKDHQSIRNETTARFLGARKDKEIFKTFPELKNKVKFPLADKVICLSATPKDRKLAEIKNQLSCFTNHHILKGINTTEEIEKRLRYFLVRGNLKYFLKDETVSRNICTHEHRQGNVYKHEKAKPLEVNDDFESIFWQLIQYQSIKHLSQKNNPSFEIGMMAGFETYTADLKRKKEREQLRKYQEKADEISSKEYEMTKNREVKQSQDINVIEGIINSYVEEFDKTPPHPKQTRLQEEIGRQIAEQDKSLIFARRVSTVYELADRFTAFYEEEIVVNLQLKSIQKNKKYHSDAINNLMEEYTERRILEHFDDLAFKLITKKEIAEYIISKAPNLEKQQQILWLKTAYGENKEFNQKIKFLLKTGKTERISTVFKELTIRSLEESRSIFFSKDEEMDEEEKKSGYFFHDFFKKGEPGFTHKTKMYREYWFDLNPIMWNNHFRIFKFSDIGLQKEINQINLKKKATKRKKFVETTKSTFSYLSIKSKYANTSDFQKSNIKGELENNTFLTRLLCECCHKEMEAWIRKRTEGKNKVKLETFILDLQVLNTILINVFRNGSGLLLGYIAEQSKPDFNKGMLDLLSDKSSPFHHILKEIKTIINDFDLIVQINFGKKNLEKIDQTLRNLKPIEGSTGRDKGNKSLLAARFRMPGFPYVLVTTDIFREGEDLHTYCQNVYHYGIAWNPSDMQQRTGRIDRINSLSYRKLNDKKTLDFDNKIQVFYPYLKHSFEVNQVAQLFRNLNKFVETFNDITVSNEYRTTVDHKEEIEDMPAQIKANLISKYDIDQFNT